jgi:hypothetical protein
MAWLLDVDLQGAGTGGESAIYEAGNGVVGFTSQNGDVAAGVASLGFAPASVRFLENDNGSKRGLSDSDQRSAIQPGFDSAPHGTGDFIAVVSTPGVDLSGNSSVTVALAFLTASSDAAFHEATDHAHREWALIAGVTNGGGGIRAEDFRLSQNYPNPFNAGTNIPFTLSGDGIRRVSLEVFNLLGQHVCTLADDLMPTGSHHAGWNGTTDSGHPVPSGVYFARLTVDGSLAQTRQMVLLK